MEQEGLQVEAEQKRREGLLPVTKVVLQRVTLRLQHIVVVVFALPSPPARLRNLPTVVRGQTMMGDTAMVIEVV